MAKTAKQTQVSKIGRSARTGQFIGRAKEGFLVPKPDFKPSSFTVRELRDAVRAAKRRQSVTQAG